jgi:hypothetical protein
MSGVAWVSTLTRRVLGVGTRSCGRTRVRMRRRLREERGLGRGILTRARGRGGSRRLVCPRLILHGNERQFSALRAGYPWPFREFTPVRLVPAKARCIIVHAHLLLVAACCASKQYRLLRVSLAAAAGPTKPSGRHDHYEQQRHRQAGWRFRKSLSESGQHRYDPQFRRCRLGEQGPGLRMQPAFRPFTSRSSSV